MERDKTKIAAAPFRLSWPAIFGGMFAAAGVWLILHVFGLAVGFSQLEPGDPSDLRATGIGGGIWTVLSSMAALFVGGMVTARAAGLIGRSNAGLHGIVLWGVTTVGGLVLIVSVMASLARGVSAVTVETITMSESAGASLADRLGLEARDLLDPVNARLSAQGKPTVTMEQLDAALRDAARTSMRQGRFDRELFTNALAQHTALSRQDAQQVFGDLEQRMSAMGQNVSRAAEHAAAVTARAFWAMFAVMLLSLASAVLGAVAGLTRRQRDLSAQVAQVTPAGLDIPDGYRSTGAR
jgi:hypothetical protein